MKYKNSHAIKISFSTFRDNKYNRFALIYTEKTIFDPLFSFRSEIFDVYDVQI